MKKIESIKVQIEELFQKINVIESKSKRENSFNIFLSLNIWYREVLVCRYLASLVKANKEDWGRDFIRTVLEVTDDNSQIQSVDLEEYISDKRRVDIVIRTKNRIYPVEVKIYASDEQRQLWDYWHYFNSQSRENNKIYYLTINGHAPSDKSIMKDESNPTEGKLNEGEQYKAISFRNHIKRWLDRFPEESSSTFFIDQFKEAISAMAKEEDIVSAVFSDEDDNLFDNWNALSAIFLHQTALLHKFRSTYIEKAIKQTKGFSDYYELEVNKKPENSGEKCYFYILRKSTTEKIARVIVHTNVFLRTEKDVPVSDGEKGWHEEKWAYLYREGTKKLNLNEPWMETLSPDDTFINLVDLLDLIVL